MKILRKVKVKIEEQERVLKNDKKRMLVSASAGSGKTYVVIKYLTKLICEDRVPVRDFVVLTFTKAAASEMKERLQKSLKQMGNDPYMQEQIDALSVANISTIHAYCEKMLKKYANLLGLKSNFSVADENQTEKISQEAFENALKIFSKTNSEDFLNLMRFYKNDKIQIRKILLELENLVGAVADKEKFLQSNLDCPDEYFSKALKFLFEEAKSEIEMKLAEVEYFHVEDFEFALRNALSPILSSKDIFEMSNLISIFKFPYLPKKKEVGEEIVDALGKIKKSINKVLDGLKALNLDDMDNVENQKFATIETLLLKLFIEFDKEKSQIKKIQNVLSFSDLESFMLKLSEKENLFAGIKYVFIDEYQDTNKIQEKIIKNIAQNSNFVAVGDVKQGIYGFRLASCEIFLKDMEEFEKDENSALNSLKSNFRSSQRILKFVNDIFKVCMTQKTSGVDYFNTSMLEGKGEFGEEKEKAVNIDVVREDKPEEKNLPEIYSVMGDEPFKNEANKKQLLAIKNRILEVMKSEIFENGQMRKCRFSDIAILFRSRSGGLFDELEQFLQENEIPVISNSRNHLFDDPLMKIFLNWLKLSLVFDDDVAMLSVLKSPIIGMTLEEIASIKGNDERLLCQIVLTNEKFQKFNDLMSDFRFDCEFFGIRDAFCKLFDKTNFWAYLNSLSDYQRKNNFVNKFLNTIVESKFEFDVAGLLSFFEKVDISVVSETTGVTDAVILTTIHNSKGLEYPIVFLCGCDKSLKGAQKNGLVEINEDFGFAVKKYDMEKNQELVSVRMKAISQSEKKKDFVEELMIFYVALTRAKNRLYLFGKETENMLKRYSIFDCDSYFDLIFFALQNIKKAFAENAAYEDDDLEVRLIEAVEELSLQKVEREAVAEVDENLYERIKQYLDFKYKIDDKLNFKLKESVTSLNKRQLEDLTEQYSNENFKFGDSSVEKGNAYHLMLKVLDFEQIETIEDLHEEITKNKNILAESEKLVEKDILYKNILLLKQLSSGMKVFKEKQFIMKEKICNLLDDVHFEDEILVQGIIDFYSIKNNEIILIDYKYSQSKNDEYLINKYKNQLKLYKSALENSLRLKVKKTYLLSLKHAKLIKISL